MCRLYGFRGSAATRLECALVRAQNALMVQSRADARGDSSADGWGIGYYHGGRPKIEKCGAAAYEDSNFLEVAGSISSATVVAHVRHATVGGGGRDNAHPFSFGTWTFAHNGTLTAFDRLAPLLENETHSELLAARRGTTDSELIFLWLLSRMARSGIASEVASRDPQLLAHALKRAVLVLATRSSAAGAESPARLNFLLTDGATLAASRWGNSLVYLVRESVHSCWACGSPRPGASRIDGYRAGAIASEPITAEPWTEAPDRSFVIIGPDIEVYTGPID